MRSLKQMSFIISQALCVEPAARSPVAQEPASDLNGLFWTRLSHEGFRKALGWAVKSHDYGQLRRPQLLLVLACGSHLMGFPYTA